MGTYQCSKLKKLTGCPNFKSRATKPVNSVALMNPWLPVTKPHIFSALHKKHPFLSSYIIIIIIIIIIFIEGAQLAKAVFSGALMH